VQDLTNRIWDIENHNLKIHHFTLQEYLDYKLNRKGVQIDDKKVIPKEIKQEAKIEIVKTNNDKLEKEIRVLEKDIALIEEELNKMNESISQLDFEKDESQLVLLDYEKIKEKLDELMKTWEDKMIGLN
jgi:Xaa-Pro aminopeptidase